MIIILYRDLTNQLQPPPIVAEKHEDVTHQWFANDILFAASSGNEKDINKATLDYLFEYKEGDAQITMIQTYIANHHTKSEMTRSKSYNKDPQKKKDKDSNSLSEICINFHQILVKIY